MNSLFTYANPDGVAVITVDNPPVKALSPGVPEGLDAALDRAAADADVRAIVVTGAGLRLRGCAVKASSARCFACKVHPSFRFRY